MKHAVIIFRTGIFDYLDILHMIYDWKTLVYDDTKESLLYNTSDELGRPVVLTHYVDANPCPDIL